MPWCEIQFKEFSIENISFQFTFAANSRPISSASCSNFREYGKRDVNVIKFSNIKFTQSLSKSINTNDVLFFVTKVYDVQSVGNTAQITNAANIAKEKDKYVK